MKTPSLNGSRHFFLIVDYYKRMSWVYFLKAKLEAFQKFIEFKVLAENNSRYFIKTLDTIKRGEFLSNEFDSFYKHDGIRRQLTIRRTPQQNGIAERKNQTLLR